MNFQITMGNKAKCTPVGRGTIIFQTEAGNKLQATNVLHVPRLGMNLLSVSTSEQGLRCILYWQQSLRQTPKLEKEGTNWSQEPQIVQVTTRVPNGPNRQY